ncbi:MAG: hypothetical protein LBQ49_02725 [Rickettsiales bacterium]|jgi:hypothetical protein|nr:hypothetical protein [Rickettsiales bacterium]
MKKSSVFIFAIILSSGSLDAAAVNPNTLLSPAQYEMMEPYLKPKAREKLKPEGAEYARTPARTMARSASDTSVIPISNFAGGGGSAGARGAVSSGASAPRRVVPRGFKAANATVARAAASTAVGGGRRVVPRGGAQVQRSALRGDNSSTSQREAVITGGEQVISPNSGITPERCLSDYSDCMDNYCRRSGTKYDRCYCSAKLQQLDAEYKPAIDAIVRQVMIKQSGGDIIDGMSQEEINEYWKNTFDSDAMANLAGALDISWAGTESSVRGQNAFVAGDDFCKQHLAGCFHMASNMKSMYRTTIGQDCKKYETYLQKMKYGAEQLLLQY